MSRKQHRTIGLYCLSRVCGDSMRRALAWFSFAVLATTAGAGDLALVTTNLGRQTSVPSGETVFSPALSVYPSRKTVMAGDTINFTVRNATNAVTWFAVENRSGATLGSTGPTSATYQAGTVATNVDVIEAWDGGYRFGRAYVNVIDPSDVAKAGKSIIIAGRRSTTDSLWPTTDYLADSAFNILRYRGYSKDNIEYLSPETNQDVDADGVANDIDLQTTLANAQLAFTNWAKSTDKLFVYLVDHGADVGGHGYFRLNESEVLWATNLCVWLDDLQNQYHTEVTLLIDCCYAGSLMDELTYTGAWKRIVVAACGTNQPTYFLAGGLVSFSDAFFSGVMLGYDVDRSWLQARDAMSTYQSAMLYENVAGSTSNLYIGASFVAGKDIPQIGLVCGNLLLDGTETATLWANDISSLYPIDRVWCLVVPPSHTADPENPVADLPELDLVYDSESGRYQADYTGFTEQGTYKVIYYARDYWNSVSSPRQSYVIQQGYEERAVLVAAGSTNDSNWPMIEYMAQDTYHTLRTRLFNNERIYYLSARTNVDLDADGTNDVDALPTLDSFASAITNWAATTNFGGPSIRLNVILIGEGTNGTLQMNDGEYLTAADFDLWLDTYEAAATGRVSVVMDFSGAGGFLGTLAGSTSRVNAASCKGTQRSLWTQNGRISFSKYFMTYTFGGSAIGESFTAARKNMRTQSGTAAQDAQLDDNGDGVANQKNVDGAAAAKRYIGSAFVTGGEPPQIGRVMPHTWLSGTNALLLWAADVTAEYSISNVYCTITPPDYDGTSELAKVDLSWDAVSNHYGAVYTNFTVPGSYACSFQAVDVSNQVSAAVQVWVSSADAYEVDDTQLEWRGITIDVVQKHNFHKFDDQEWVKFYAMTDYNYEVTTYQLGTNVDTVLDIWFETEDGVLTNVGVAGVFTNIDDEACGEGVGEYARIEHPPEGFYCIRVRSGNTNCWGADSPYDLKVEIPTGGMYDHLLVLGLNALTAGAPPTGVKAHLSNGHELSFSGKTSVDFVGEANGTYTVTLTGVPTGWQYLQYPSSQRVSVPSSSCYAQFVICPYVGIAGSVRDAWTGARISGANLTFLATSGRISGQSSAWSSESDGDFPSDIDAVTVNWRLTISKSGYSNLVVNLGASTWAAGTTTNIGIKQLVPLDANTNLIADSWETTYFGAGSNVNAFEDTDLDGQLNWEEYRSGTHPTNGTSYLMINENARHSATGFSFSWPVADGRTYQVLSADVLPPPSWPVAGGPWETSYGQTQMQWTDTTTVSAVKRFYRIDVVPP